jgi:uncharacterized membrane protein YphA (DoxX/SURF4 family)
MPTEERAARLAAAAAWGLRLVVAGVLGVAGALKLRDPGAFAREIGNFQLAPELAPWLGAALPTAELAAAAALLLPWPAWRRAGALAAAALFALFTFAVLWALGRGIDVSCGCFGARSGAVTWLTALRNAGLLAAAGALLALDHRGVHRGRGPDSGDRPPAPATAARLAVSNAEQASPKRL